jgi:hypothetical protein
MLLELEGGRGTTMFFADPVVEISAEPTHHKVQSLPPLHWPEGRNLA